ncbi:MAG TPA: HNH endonuclease signature motif containing protein [Mycobacteriales bacterium]|nr:HNH endonuclease signature motif containing protein [Mycobacteriales bacterium]
MAFAGARAAVEAITAGLGGMDESGLFAVLGQLEAHAGWLSTVQNWALCALRDRVAARVVRGGGDDRDWAREQVMLAQRLGPYEAHRRLQTALALRDRLPRLPPRSPPAGSPGGTRTRVRHAGSTPGTTATAPARSRLFSRPRTSPGSRRRSDPSPRRWTRAISGPQRNAVPTLLSISVVSNGCRMPGCDRLTNLHLHHVQHWIDGGRTDQANLTVVCAWHHAAVHEAG